VACRALSERNEAPEKASRPWDRGRDGFVLGEGAGAVVLESLDHALERGAPIIAEYLGGGVSCDAYHMTNIKEDGSGIALAIERSLKDANIPKERVNYINAHATATQLGDMAEVAGIQHVFGDHRKKLKMNGTKSLIGHALGGAGGVELIVTLLALQRGELHPTLNLEDPEPALDIDCVPFKAQKHEIDVALKNSFGFGGHNSCIAVTRYQP
jgi:3-oxoacyl-[acyl-carrier-protein] synthase II